MSKLAELIAGASPPISRAPKRLVDTPVTLHSDRKLELETLLHLRDGFRACEGALLVRPSVTVAAVRGVEDWNQLTLWRTPYRGASELLFFAEDAFGRQFGLYKDEVMSFEPRRGTTEHCGFSLERWAEHVLGDPEVLGAGRLAKWEAAHGALGMGDRLQPRDPMLAWEDDDGELRRTSDLELMRLWARYHVETREGELTEPEWWWGEDA